ncbi:hypothetical protein Btru_032551 [Bulinus truncatus]|nr:hypothetical protein Btru_032551 [Bulinus truncatus]
MIRQLSDDVKTCLRTGVAITSFSQVVEELVLNSVDAGASNVAARVDLETFKVQVVDNGVGIVKDQLPLLGERYATSKCKSVEDLLHLRYFGYRGEALASLRAAAAFVEIVSRPRSSGITYCKYFKDGKPLDITQSSVPRPSHGTTVTAHNMFYNLPVRRKCLNEGLEMERIRYRMAGLAIMWPQISFSLRDDRTGHVILQTHKCNSIIAAFSEIFPVAKSRNLSEVLLEKDEFKLSGVVSTDSYSRKDFQFVFVNKRVVLKSSIHHQINKIFGKSLILKRRGLGEGIDNAFQSGPLSNVSPTKQRDRYAIYAINIECPYHSYDITLDPQKTLVEFTDWPKVIHLIQEMLYGFLQKENLLSISDFTSFSNNAIANDGTDSSGEEAENFEMASNHLNVLDRFIRKNDSNKIEETVMQPLLNSDPHNSMLTEPVSSEFTSCMSDDESTDAVETIDLKSTSSIESGMSGEYAFKEKEMFDKLSNLYGSDVPNYEEPDLRQTSKKIKFKEQRGICKKTNEIQKCHKIISVANSDLPSAPCVKPHLISNNVGILQVNDLETPFVFNKTKEEIEDVLVKNNPQSEQLQQVTLGKLATYSSTLQSLRGNNSIVSHRSLRDAGVITSTLQPLRTFAKKAAQSLGDMYKTPVQKINPQCTEVDMESVTRAEKTQIHVTCPDPQHSRMFSDLVESRTCGPSDRKVHSKRSQVETLTHASKLAKLMKGEKIPSCGSANVEIPKVSKKHHFLNTFLFKKQKPSCKVGVQKTEKLAVIPKKMETSLTVSTIPVHSIGEPKMNITTANLDYENVLFKGISSENYMLNTRSQHASSPQYQVQLSRSCHSTSVISDKHKETFIAVPSSPSLYASNHISQNSDVSCFETPETVFPLKSQSEDMVPKSGYTLLSQSNQRKLQQDVIYSADARIWSSHNKKYSVTSTDNCVSDSLNPEEVSMEKICKCASIDRSEDENLQKDCQYIPPQNNNSGTQTKCSTGIKMHNSSLQDEVSKSKDSQSSSYVESFLQCPKLNSLSRSHGYEYGNEPTEQSSTNFSLLASKILNKCKENASKTFLSPLNEPTESKKSEKNSSNHLPVNICQLSSPVQIAVNQQLENKSNFEHTSLIDVRNQLALHKGVSHAQAVCNAPNLDAVQNETISNDEKTENGIESLVQYNKKVKADSTNSTKPRNDRHIAVNACSVENKNVDEVISENLSHQTLLQLHNSKLLIDKHAHNDISTKVLDVTDIFEYMETEVPNVLVTDTLSTTEGSCLLPHLQPLSELRKSAISSSVENGELPKTLSDAKSIIAGQSSNHQMNSFAHESVTGEYNDLTLVLESAKNLTPVHLDNAAESSCWQELKNDCSGKKMYVNIKSGHTLSEDHYQNITLDTHDMHDVHVNETEDSAVGQLTGSQKNCLQNIVNSYVDQERLDAESKWKEGEKPIYEKNQSTDISGLLTQWNNPVFLNYKSPTLHVETCPSEQSSKSFYNYISMIEFSKDMLKNVKVIGQVDKKFIACLINTKASLSRGSRATNSDDNTLLVLFDQHAVHERIRLEQFTQDNYEVIDGVKTQQIKKSDLPEPLLMTVDIDDLRIMKTFSQEFNRIGIVFTTDPTCRNQIYINTVPNCLAEKSATDMKRTKLNFFSVKIQNLISEHIQLLKATNGAGGCLPLFLHRILCSQACHGAVKFGDILSKEECQSLLSSLASCDLPFQCAHGRPSVAPLVDLTTIDEEPPNSLNHKRTNETIWRVKIKGLKVEITMVAFINITHVFKYPVDKVAEAHLTKYPTEKEPTVIRMETKEHVIDHNKGADYRRRWAYCQNVVPQIMRVINVLNEKEIIFEEEAWLNLHNNSLRIESKNISFSDYARLWEESKFFPSSENPSWTTFEQHGQITVKHLGPFNRVLEMFAKKCFSYGAVKALKVMEEILYERSISGDANTDQGAC